MELGVGVNHQSHIDVLAQVICDNERLRCVTLDEDIFEVNSLGTHRDLLQLLARKLSRAVFELVLSGGLWLELALNKFVRHELLFGAQFILVVDRLILGDRPLDI